MFKLSTFLSALLDHSRVLTTLQNQSLNEGEMDIFGRSFSIRHPSVILFHPT